MSLTVKQEKFCQVYIKTGNASEAYRQAYNASKMKEATVNNNAHKLLKNNEITTRLNELKNASVKRHNITIDTLINDLKDAKKVALEAQTPQVSAAISAIKEIARLAGFDKTTIDLISSDGSMSQQPTKIILVAGEKGDDEEGDSEE